jgi:hypothetical protein
MPNVNTISAPINPDGKYAYFDKVQIWLRQPLNDNAIQSLQSQCGQGGLHVTQQTARFDFSLQQRLQLNQPSQQALQRLSKRNDVHLNAIEFALDLTFVHEDEKDDAFAFISFHHIKKWHGKQHVKFANGTRYAAQRTATNNLTLYADRPSKATGEINCVHCEWRTKGRKALSRLGIVQIRDLLNFDHHAFWSKRLLLYRINHDRLGRAYNNQQMNTNRRDPWLHRTEGGFVYNMDKRTGAILVRAFASIQQLIDAKTVKDTGNCLVPITVNQLMPEQGTGKMTKTERIERVLNLESGLST